MLVCIFNVYVNVSLYTLQCDYDRLNLSTTPFMERNVEFLIECMEDLSSEQNKV